ncbi:hypothetical protein RQP46_010916 [Phenoliferia psychrophenolica]
MADQASPSSYAQAAFTPVDVAVPPPSLSPPFIDTSASSPSPPPASSPPSDSPPVLFGASELEASRLWNEQRIERRLRGEYERAGQHLSDLVNENLETRLRLNAIRVIGASHTRPSFLRSLFTPFLPSVPSHSYLSPPSPSSDDKDKDRKPQTLRSLLNTTRNLSGLLNQFDIFSEVDASLEASPSVLAENDDVDIVLRVKEASRYFLRTATDIGDGEGNATATARIRNAFGGAEMLEGNLAFGTRTKSAFQLRLDTPLNASPLTRFDLSVFSAQRDLNYYASCSEATRGVQARIRTTTSLGYHELAYDAIHRTISDILPIASLSIRDAAGATVKSSLSHTFLRDTRDDPFLATTGSHLKLKQEFAGLGGDSSFVKAEGEFSSSRSLGGGCSMSLGLRAGALYPLNGKPSLFSDRYHLGGPTSVRMFRPNAMGPKDNGDFIGGDLHWAAGLSLVTPFPLRPLWPLKSHFFINAGKLSSFTDSPTPIKNLLSEPSVTAGMGLMYRHSLVRVEANLGVPLAMGAQEGGVKGLQFGLGLAFL